jgi:hypothetical protein
MGKDLQTLNGQNKLALWAGRSVVPKKQTAAKANPQLYLELLYAKIKHHNA